MPMVRAYFHRALRILSLILSTAPRACYGTTQDLDGLFSFTLINTNHNSHSSLRRVPGGLAIIMSIIQHYQESFQRPSFRWPITTPQGDFS